MTEFLFVGPVLAWLAGSSSPPYASVSTILPLNLIAFPLILIVLTSLMPTRSFATARVDLE
jgi:hypothetical protein